MRLPASLQTRLTLLILGSVLLFGALAGYESYRNALHEADELFDAQLAQFAQNLLAVADVMDDERAAPLLPRAHKYQQELFFELRVLEDDEPRVLLRSDAAPLPSMRELPVKGYATIAWNGGEWRFYHEIDTRRGIEVVAGQSDKARKELAAEVAWHNISPFLFGLPLLGMLSALAIRFGLKPLRRLTTSLRRLAPDRLEPISLEDPPKEIGPVLDALNTLLARTAGQIENERRFTADAAHELRTPLAALQAQLQAAQLSEDEAGRLECLTKSRQGASRMSHLVDQLLILSRLDEWSAPARFEQLDLTELARTCVAEIAPQAMEKGITLEFEDSATVTVSASEDLLRILLRNLLDNAIRYTPQGGRVTITTRNASLTIADNGPGVPAEAMALLGKRFHRLDHAATEGVGLGLSIVMRIVTLHRAHIEFHPAQGQTGLSVTVHFPPAS